MFKRNKPLHIYTTSSVFIHQWMNSHLGCFRILTFVNKAVINIACAYPLEFVFSYSLGKYQVVWLLDCRVALLLTFWRTSILFSRVAASTFIPTNNAQVFFLLHILANLVSCVFDISYSDRCEVISHCSFDLHFPDDEW